MAKKSSLEVPIQSSGSGIKRQSTLSQHHDHTGEPIILDIGSGYIKAGFANHRSPELIVPSVYASVNDKEYFGEEVTGKTFSQIPAKQRIYPIVEGIIKDWEVMYKLLEYTFDKLKCDPENHKIFMT